MSILTRCYHSLNKYGVEKRLKAVYGELMSTPEGSYDATLRINLAKAPNNPGTERALNLVRPRARRSTALLCVAGAQSFSRRLRS